MALKPDPVLLNRADLNSGRAERVNARWSAGATQEGPLVGNLCRSSRSSVAPCPDPRVLADKHQLRIKYHSSLAKARIIIEVWRRYHTTATGFTVVLRAAFSKDSLQPGIILSRSDRR